ncbi:hypothetical protein MRX96_008888 [Rhipicephalus microplus]
MLFVKSGRPVPPTIEATSPTALLDRNDRSDFGRGDAVSIFGGIGRCEENEADHRHEEGEKEEDTRKLVKKTRASACIAPRGLQAFIVDVVMKRGVSRVSRGLKPLSIVPE